MTAEADLWHRPLYPKMPEGPVGLYGDITYRDKRRDKLRLRSNILPKSIRHIPEFILHIRVIYETIYILAVWIHTFLFIHVETYLNSFNV